MSVLISFSGKKRVGNYEKKVSLSHSGFTEKFHMQIIHNDIQWLIYLLIMDYS